MDRTVTRLTLIQNEIEKRINPQRQNRSDPVAANGTDNPERDAAKIKNPKTAAPQRATNRRADEANRRLLSTRACPHETNQHQHMDKRIDLQVTRSST
jgi:hypothetical protein